MGLSEKLNRPPGDLLTIEVYIDGGCRPNPGRGSFGYVILIPGSPVEGSGLIGHTTNNQAEYWALIEALSKASELGLSRLFIHSDSQLVVRQMSGRYRVKNQNIRQLHSKACTLCRGFTSVKFIEIPRERNTWADSLASSAFRSGGHPINNHNTPHRVCPTCGQPVTSEFFESLIL